MSLPNSLARAAALVDPPQSDDSQYIDNSPEEQTPVDIDQPAGAVDPPAVVEGGKGKQINETVTTVIAQNTTANSTTEPYYYEEVTG